jgi:purine-binding chemotaxis protein CheW
MISSPTQLEATSAGETCRSIVFTIANHWLALPLAAVLKIMTTKAIPLNEIGGQSLIYLDQDPITLVNLHPVLSGVLASSSTSPANVISGQFLLITGLYGYPQWAIPVDEAPTLLELPLDSVRLLPNTYRESIHNLACHVAVLSNRDLTPTVLLLNLQQFANFKEFS